MGMTYVDAAVSVLSEQKKAMHLDDIVAEVVRRKLLKRVSKTPSASMKARLTTEAKKKNARVALIEVDIWGLSENITEEDVAKAPRPKKNTKRKVKTTKKAVDSEKVSAKATKTESRQSSQKTLSSEIDGDQLADAEVGTETQQVSVEEDLPPDVGFYWEFRDRQTSDEDRLMRPAIRQEKTRFRGGGDRNPRTGDRSRDRSRKKVHGKDATRGQRKEESTAKEPAVFAEAIVGVMAKVEAILGGLRKPNPLPIRQLVQMLKKRRWIEGDPNKIWGHIHASVLAALAGDVDSMGKVLRHGRGHFVLSEATKEIGVAELAASVSSDARQWVHARLLALSPAGFEKVAHVYLTTLGYTSIDWIKDAGDIRYAVAVPPGRRKAILIGAHSGAEPVGRRGVGELRIGIEKKQLSCGLLLSAGVLSEIAEEELSKHGASVTACCGVEWVSHLWALRIGILRKRVDVLVPYSDFWDVVDE